MNNRTIRIAIAALALSLASSAFAASAQIQTPASDRFGTNYGSTITEQTDGLLTGRSVAANDQSVEHRWTNNVGRNFYGQ